MRWNTDGSNDDIEDRRDESGGGFNVGGFGGMHLGIGGVLVVGVLSLLFHENLFSVFSGGSGPLPSRSYPEAGSSAGPSAGGAPSRQDVAETEEFKFVRFVLNDDQGFWDETLPQQAGIPYRHAHLVLYRDEYPSACGEAQVAIGPFYCPADQKVYLDLGFMNELANRFGAPGKFAQAYVVAHELGHHVQRLRGIEGKVERAEGVHPEERNELSVRLELQADCYAGVWGHHAKQQGIIDATDVNDGLGAAAAVGDDRLQKMARGRVDPDSFTHGTSAQRASWFKRGLDSGQISSCNTFGTGAAENSGDQGG